MKYYIQDIDEGGYFLIEGKGHTDKKEEAHEYSSDAANWMLDFYGSHYVQLIPVENLQLKKILIIGDAQHGKDAFADMICKEYGYSKESSSMASLKIFLRKILETKYNLSYGSIEEAFEDRKNHRTKWFEEISLYNKDDKTRLAKEILKTNNIYVGMRCEQEIEQCKKDGVFDIVIGLVDYRKPSEPKASNSIDIFKNANIIVCNNGTLEDLEKTVVELKSILI